MDQIHITFCADRDILPGLHVSLLSAVKNLKTGCHASIHLIHKDLQAKDIRALNTTLQRADIEYSLEELPVDLNSFSELRGLHGNRMPYTKLLIPELVRSDKTIYLDCDLIVNTDLTRLYEMSLQGKTLGAVSHTAIKWSIDNTLFESLGFSLDAPYFNSGVLLFDLAAWRRADLTRACMEFACKYRDRLVTADQTVLNYVFYDNFFCIPAMYNRECYPGSAPFQKSEAGIMHLVGSPKPWNLFGEFFNRQSGHFLSYLDETAYAGYRTYKAPSLSAAKKSLRLSRSYYMAIRTRFQR